MKTALHVFEHFDNMNVTEVNLGNEVVKMSGLCKSSSWCDLIDWLVFNVQRAIFQLYSGREHLKIWTPQDSKQGKVMGMDGKVLPVNRSLMDHSSWAYAHNELLHWIL